MNEGTVTPADSLGSHPLHQLDRLLRGEATRLSALRRGTVEISPGSLTLAILALGLIYGACMGSYALFQPGGASPAQFITTIGKVPLLFLLTLVVTFPSLYVFNALVGSRLNLVAVGRLIVAALAVMLTILASLGPIVAFFSLSTTSYPFMLLLNIIVFTVSGVLGLRFLLLTLHRLTLVQNEADRAAHAREMAAEQNEAHESAGALEYVSGDVLNRNVTRVFTIWIMVFGLVGAQMAWVLRPFLGHPGTPFELFRDRQSNFFEAVLNIINHL